MKLQFFDTETTGLQDDCRLVQLAMLDGQTGARKVIFCNPGVEISLDAMATHHITNKKVKTFPPFQEMHKDLLQLMADKFVFVAHNAAYDVMVMKNEGINISDFICTKKVAQSLLDLPNYKLQYLRYYFDCEFEEEINPHDAMSDTLVLREVFNQLANLVQLAYKLDADDLDTIHQIMIDITARPVLLRKISFGKHAGTEFSKVPKDYLRWLDGQGNHDEDLQFTLDTYLGKLKI